MADRYFEGKKQGANINAILNAIKGDEVEQRMSLNGQNWIVFIPDGVEFPNGIMNRFTELTLEEAQAIAASDDYQDNASMIFE